VRLKTKKRLEDGIPGDYDLTQTVSFRQKGHRGGGRKGRRRRDPMRGYSLGSKSINKRRYLFREMSTRNFLGLEENSLRILTGLRREWGGGRGSIIRKSLL